MRMALGQRGATLIALGIAVSTLGYLSQAVLTAPRVYFAMAKDRLFFRQLASVHPRTQAPVLAIAIQSVWTMVILLTGGYEKILNYVTSMDVLFWALQRLAFHSSPPKSGAISLFHARTSIYHCALLRGLSCRGWQYSVHVPENTSSVSQFWWPAFPCITFGDGPYGHTYSRSTAPSPYMDWAKLHSAANSILPPAAWPISLCPSLA